MASRSPLASLDEQLPNLGFSPPFETDPAMARFNQLKREIVAKRTAASGFTFGELAGLSPEFMRKQQRFIITVPSGGIPSATLERWVAERKVSPEEASEFLRMAPGEKVMLPSPLDDEKDDNARMSSLPSPPPATYLPQQTYNYAQTFSLLNDSTAAPMDIGGKPVLLPDNDPLNKWDSIHHMMVDRSVKLNEMLICSGLLAMMVISMYEFNNVTQLHSTDAWLPFTALFWSTVTSTIVFSLYWMLNVYLYMQWDVKANPSARRLPPPSMLIIQLTFAWLINVAGLSFVCVMNQKDGTFTEARYMKEYTRVMACWLSQSMIILVPYLGRAYGKR